MELIALAKARSVPNPTPRPACIFSKDGAESHSAVADWYKVWSWGSLIGSGLLVNVDCGFFFGIARVYRGIVVSTTLQCQSMPGQILLTSVTGTSAWVINSSGKSRGWGIDRLWMVDENAWRSDLGMLWQIGINRYRTNAEGFYAGGQLGEPPVADRLFHDITTNPMESESHDRKV